MDYKEENALSDQVLDDVHGGAAHTVRPHIEKEKCIKCRQCQATCMTGAITVNPGGVTVKVGLCNGCGDCANVCPTGAVTMVGM